MPGNVGEYYPVVDGDTDVARMHGIPGDEMTVGANLLFEFVKVFTGLAEGVLLSLKLTSRRDFNILLIGPLNVIEKPVLHFENEESCVRRKKNEIGFPSIDVRTIPTEKF
jgi:hypothetical protein